jgi:hypothetical protein
MIYLLCRNRVKNFEKWKAVFDSQTKVSQEAGLKLLQTWRSIEDPNNVFFLFEAASVEKARAFMNHPDAAKAGEDAGVLDGECHFIEGV